MPTPITILLACATLTALGLGEPAGRADTTGAGVQLRSGEVKELAAGKLLVAVRGLPDPNFAETVILLADHSGEGTMGLVINRRTDVPLARAFPDLKPGRGPSSVLYSGGPVATDAVVGLERSRAATPDGRQVLADVRIVASREALQALISSGAGPDRFRVYVGYAGWGPGQLERETLHGSWHVFRADTTVVFDPDPETLWQRQIRRTEERMASALP
jgi:putative transcriptional regulator